MRGEVLKRLVCGLDYGAWGDGGAGHGVEAAAVFADLPLIGWGVGQAASVELGNPLVLGDFDVIAQAGGFVVRCHAYAGDAAIGVNPHQQADFTGIAVGRGGFQHDRR